MRQVFSSYSASISELKKNPTALLNEAEGAPIPILNHNVPVTIQLFHARHRRAPLECRDERLKKIGGLFAQR